MFITDKKIIAALTADFIDDAIRASVAKAIMDTRTTKEERKPWLTVYLEHHNRSSARIETIDTIDTSLFRNIHSAFLTIEEEAWAEAGEKLGVTGTPREMITALGADYADIFDVIYNGIEHKVQAAVDRMVALRVAEQEARNADAQ